MIIAPKVSARPPATWSPPKPNVRLLECGEWPAERSAGWDFKRVNGGLLVQSRDIGMIKAEDLKVVTKRAPTEQEIHDLMFAWKVAKFVKSNAIVYAKDRQTIGVGAGQMSRVNSARIAAIKAEHAGLQVPGAVMASDAFFPFRDGIDNAAQSRHRRGDPAGRLDARRGSHRRRRRSRHGHGVHRHAPLPALIDRAVDGFGHPPYVQRQISRVDSRSCPPNGPQAQPPQGERT